MISRPLDGLKVLAIENFIAGPFASMWLADAGAEVVKVERPDGGDFAREVGPWRDDSEGQKRSLGLLRSNRNKKSICLDLKHPDGHRIFKDLIKSADVLVENLRPDALTKLNLSYKTLREINPRLIYLGISGFGHDDILKSPLSDKPAFDVIGQAMSGLMMRPATADIAPVYLGFSLADIVAGMVGAYGVTLALIQRGITGRGQKVDVSLYDSCVVLNELSVALFGVSGKSSPPGLHALSAPFGAYRARDGFIVIAVLGEHIWERFCSAIGQPALVSDPRFADGMARGRNLTVLNEIIDGWLGSQSRSDALSCLDRHGVPASAVQDVADLFSCEHLSSRKMLLDMDDPAWGRIKVVGNPVKMSDTPDLSPRSAPALGQDTDDVLKRWINLDSGSIDRLRCQGVV